MQYALTRGTRKLTEAEDANRWSEYACPTCGARVSLRVGKKREAHFAHWPGEGRPDCELYFPGSHGEIGGSLANASLTPEDLREEPDLGLEVTPDSWNLFLRVPEIPADEFANCSLKVLQDAYVGVHSGNVEVDRIPALEIRPGVGAARALIPPTATPYDLRPGGVWPQAVSTQRWSVTARGLKLNGTIFRVRHSEWTRLREGSVVECSESLLVLAINNAPPPQLCISTALGSVTSQGTTWCAWRVTLPTTRHEVAVRWLRTFGLDLTESSWKVAIVNLPLEIDSANLPVYRNGEEIAARLTAPGAGDVSTITLASGSNRTSIEVKAGQDAQCFLALVCAFSGEHSISAGDHVDSKVTFRTRDSDSVAAARAALATVPRLRLHLGSASLEPWTAPVQCSRRDVLLRPRKVELLGLEALDVQVSLEWKGGDGDKREPSLSLTSAERLLSKLVGAASITEMRLDGGAFGAIDVAFRPYDSQPLLDKTTIRTARFLATALAAQPRDGVQSAYVLRQLLQLGGAVGAGVSRGSARVPAALLRRFARTASGRRAARGKTR
jgi:hypothetical protein